MNLLPEECEWQAVVDDNILDSLISGDVYKRVFAAAKKAYPLIPYVPIYGSSFSILTCVKGNEYELFDIKYNTSIGVFRTFEFKFHLDDTHIRKDLGCE